MFGLKKIQNNRENSEDMVHNYYTLPFRRSLSDCLYNDYTLVMLSAEKISLKLVILLNSIHFLFGCLSL